MRSIPFVRDGDDSQAHVECNRWDKGDNRWDEDDNRWDDDDDD